MSNILDGTDPATLVIMDEIMVGRSHGDRVFYQLLRENRDQEFAEYIYRLRFSTFRADCECPECGETGMHWLEPVIAGVRRECRACGHDWCQNA